MATQTVAAPTMVKRAGPPVPPRPQHTAAAAGLLKTQRESVMNAMSRATTTTQQPTSSANGRVTLAQATEHSQATASPPPVTQKKPAAAPVGGGRTVIYKSPSMHMPKRREEQQQQSPGAPLSTRHSIGTPAPRPPLKLRKAPDVPTAQKPKVEPRAESKAEPKVDIKAADDAAEDTTHKVELRHSMSAPRSPPPSNNIVIVQSSNGVNLSRHHSMGSPKTNGATAKDTRLSLGRADLERVSIGGKIQLDQLQPAQPLPKPRKIVKVPVATLDIEGTNLAASPTTSTSNTSAVSGIFRRSKTTLDNFASRANITTISTVNASNSFLSGKTAEIKNNLKNAAERLFSEIIVSQQKHIGDSPTVITKHERAIQHQALLEQELAQERARRLAGGSAAAITVVASEPASNCTRININAATPTRNATAASGDAAVVSPTKSVKIGNVLSSTEKKAAFHEILISELAAMRTRSCSMENLQSKQPSSPILKPQMLTKSATTTPIKASTNNNNFSGPNKMKNNLNNSMRKRCNSVEDHDPDTEDVDADNVEDAEGDEDEANKTHQVGVNSSPRKRCPSGCSSDSSPYGTERSARIRTSDWIEVGDNGKEVTMTSCHISLEDSGLEDEERLDEMSSSGVGDSWDSVKEAENVKRCRNVKRIMSITDLPPLPKSLSGFNKMLGSDSGLISDADANTESNNNNDNNLTSIKSSNNTNNNLNNSNIKLEYQKDVTNSNKNDSNSNSNSSNSNENDVSTTITEGENELSATAASATTTTSAAATTTTTTATGSTLDTQLAFLRKEMYGLRQLDLSLLSQLWALNDSIQEFRTMLEEQDQEHDPDSYSPHSPTPSSYESGSSDGEEDITATNHSANKSTETTPKIITTQPKLKQTNSSAISTPTPTTTPTTAAAPPAPSAPLQKPPASATTPTANAKVNAAASNGGNVQQAAAAAKPPLPKPLDIKPVPRMRSAPPPPPVNRKAAAPPRPT